MVDPNCNFTVKYSEYFQGLYDPEDNDESPYDTVDLYDFEFSEATRTFTYPCPCGDMFLITLSEILAGETVARCPSCSLVVHVVYEKKDAMKYC